VEAPAVGSRLRSGADHPPGAEAQGSKAPIPALADPRGGVFVPVIIALALVVFGVWWAVGGDS